MFTTLISAFGPLFFLASGDIAGAHDHHTHLPAAHKHHPKTGHHAGYVKPGAAVSLVHDYDGKTALGAYETVMVTLGHIYETGSLSVNVLSTPELQISAFTPVKNMPLYSGSTLDLPIQFSALKKGNFSLSLEVVHIAPEGHQSRRILSVPVNIGQQTEGKSHISQTIELPAARQTGLIIMPAQEVIE